MNEIVHDTLMTATGWAGGITVALSIHAAWHRRFKTALVFGGLSVPLGVGALYLISQSV